MINLSEGCGGEIPNRGEPMVPPSFWFFLTPSYSSLRSLDQAEYSAVGLKRSESPTWGRVRNTLELGRG